MTLSIEEHNYGLHIASQQNDLLVDPLMRLDMVVARDAGLDEPQEILDEQC